MSDFIERSMKEFANQFDKKFGDMVFIKTREIEDLQAGVKKLCNRIDELKTENTELKAINMDLVEALEDIVNQAKNTKMAIPADLSDSIRIFGDKALRKALELLKETEE